MKSQPVYGTPTPPVLGPTPTYRGNWLGSLNGSSATVTITTAALASSNLLLLGGNEKNSWNHRRGAFNLSQTGYDWPSSASQSGSAAVEDYPCAVWALGKRNAVAVPSNTFSLYSQAIWTGYGIFEFPGLKMELLWQQSIWQTAGTTFSLTIPATEITESNLVIVACVDNDSGITGPSAVSSGWTGVFFNNNGIGFKINPPVMVSQTVTFTSPLSNNSGHNWGGTMLVLR